MQEAGSSVPDQEPEPSSPATGSAPSLGAVDSLSLGSLSSQASMAWLQPRWQVEPQDIFFASRASGRLCRLGKGAFGTVSIFGAV